MERFVVCDFYHEDCSVNIDAVCATFEDAYKAMLKDINDLLEDYSDTEEKAEANIYANSAMVTIDGDVICDWRIRPVELELTASEEGEIFRKLSRENIKQDVCGWLEENWQNWYSLSAAQVEELTSLVEKNLDCNVPYNAMLEATAEEYLHSRF